MGFIDAVRAWLFGADDDTDESGDRTDASDDDGPDAGDGGESSASDGADEPDGLDPGAATETRTAAATDDAVDALRDVRESGPPGDADGEPGEDETDADGERLPDDDRRKR
jgi:hypothetical protein